MAPAEDILHASCVAHEGRAVLITGPSGAGKSALVLQLMALGAELVADDRTCLRREAGGLIASAPAAIAGLIEARFVGIFRSPSVVAEAPVALVVDLSFEETARLPEPRSKTLMGVTLPCFAGVAAPHFAATVLLWLGGRLIARP